MYIYIHICRDKVMAARRKVLMSDLRKKVKEMKEANKSAASYPACSSFSAAAAKEQAET